MVSSILKRLLVISALVGFTSAAFAEQMQKFGDLEVHYMALSSTFITPEVAKAYDIERSRFQGLINISVLDTSKKGKPAKEVEISGFARNLVGHLNELDFRPVKEGSAIYYLASINYRNEEKYNFEITITDGGQQHTLKFSQMFYVD